MELPEDWCRGNVSWLTVEDFNACGLADDLTTRNSNFWNYWLNFGLSNKDGSGRGGRGIGRVTFLIASRINSVIGHTRSADGLVASCGMAVLRAMVHGNDFRSTHAYLAKDINGSIFRLHDSDDFQENISDAFRFHGYRGESESGLALAVLYPHKELTSERILAAAIENFAPAIMDGSLELHVNSRMLSASSIEQLAQENDISECFNNLAIKDDPERFLELIRRSTSTEFSEHFFLHDAAAKNLHALSKDPKVKSLQKKLSERKHVLLQIEFPLVHNGNTTEVALTAILQKTPEPRDPIDRFFREGMALPEVRAGNLGDLDAILMVDDGLLATYLNCCEGKAHLNLLESKQIRQKLADSGFQGISIKRLVKNLPSELRTFLTPEVTAPDSTVFDRYFAKPVYGLGGTSKKPRKNPTKPSPRVPRKPPSFIADTLAEGLRIRSNPESKEWPINFTLSLAYADGSRRPSWNQHDFKLQDLTISHTNCRIEFKGNVLRAFDCVADTTIEISGFDNNRELDTIIRPWKKLAQND